MYELSLAMSEALTTKPRFIIISIDKGLIIDDVPKAIKPYMKTHCYIDGTVESRNVIKKLR